MKRIIVRFTGRVQGVGFRFTTCRVAGDFAVTGYVKNMSDGRVEMLAEGQEDELHRFLHAVQQAMMGFVRDTEIADAPGPQGHSTFSVAY